MISFISPSLTAKCEFSYYIGIGLLQSTVTYSVYLLYIYSHPSLHNGHFDLFVPLASGHHFLLYLIRHHREAEPYNVVVVVIFFSGGGAGWGAELVFFHMYYNYFYSFY